MIYRNELLLKQHKCCKYSVNLKDNNLNQNQIIRRANLNFTFKNNRSNELSEIYRFETKTQ